MDHPSEAGKGERRAADAYANWATDCGSNTLQNYCVHSVLNDCLVARCIVQGMYYLLVFINFSRRDFVSNRKCTNNIDAANRQM